jgi:hypothetical protein
MAAGKSKEVDIQGSNGRVYIDAPALTKSMNIKTMVDKVHEWCIAQCAANGEQFQVGFFRGAMDAALATVSRRGHHPDCVASWDRRYASSMRTPVPNQAKRQRKRRSRK